MKYCDVYVTHENAGKKLEMARRLDLNRIGLTVSTNDNVGEFLKAVPSLDSDVDIVKCVLIHADTPRKMANLVTKYRDRFEVVMVFGGDYMVNRAAAEDSRVDILLHPEFRRNDSGMDHVIAKAAYENRVAIGISIHSLLTTYKKLRSQILAHHSRNLRICEKFNVPVVLASGAISEWEMRDMRELVGIASVLGYPLNRAMEAVTDTPNQIVDTNRKKLSGRMISNDVEVVE